MVDKKILILYDVYLFKFSQYISDSRLDCVKVIQLEVLTTSNNLDKTFYETALKCLWQQKSGTRETSQNTTYEVPAFNYGD